MIKVGIVGGSGYTGVELLRILSAHPEVRLTTITARGDNGTKVADCFRPCAASSIWLLSLRKNRT